MSNFHCCMNSIYKECSIRIYNIMTSKLTLTIIYENNIIYIYFFNNSFHFLCFSFYRLEWADIAYILFCDTKERTSSNKNMLWICPA